MKWVIWNIFKRNKLQGYKLLKTLYGGLQFKIKHLIYNSGLKQLFLRHLLITKANYVEIKKQMINCMPVSK